MVGRVKLNCFQDIVMRIPVGCSQWGFAFQWLAEEGRIGQEEVARYFDHYEQKCPLPDGVTDIPTDMHPSEIYPACNPRSMFPGSVKVWKLTPRKGKKILVDVEKLLGEVLPGNNYIYRGTSRLTAELSMDRFCNG